MLSFTPKIMAAAVIMCGSVSLFVATKVEPIAHKDIPETHSTMTVGSYVYKVVRTHNSLGQISFPPNDAKGTRIMQLPDESFGASQLEQSIVHEKLHACMHDHDHDFLTPAELQAHLQTKTYTEEDVVEILAPCLVALKQKQNGLF